MKTFNEMNERLGVQREKLAADTRALTSQLVYQWVAALDAVMENAHRSESPVSEVQVFSNQLEVAYAARSLSFFDDALATAADDVVARFQDLGFEAYFTKRGDFTGVTVHWE